MRLDTKTAKGLGTPLTSVIYFGRKGAPPAVVRFEPTEETVIMVNNVPPAYRPDTQYYLAPFGYFLLLACHKHK
jgi:hypothetical protein